MPEMTSLDKLRRRELLEGQRDEVNRAIREEEDGDEREDLRKVLAKIEEEIASIEPIAVVTAEGVSAPVLPDSCYMEALPSRRLRRKTGRYEGGPTRSKSS